MQRTFPEGVTCWIDLDQDDISATKSFYGQLFGWSFEETPLPYWIAKLDGNVVAGVGQGAGVQGWNSYFAVDDVDQTVKAVVAEGGQVVVEKTDIPAGSFAVCSDVQGAQFSVWRAGTRHGVDIANVPNTWNFSNLQTTDPQAAFDFYKSIFGWTNMGEDPALGVMVQVPGYGDHLAATVDPDIYERQSGAPEGFADVIGGIEPLAPPIESPCWHVKFSVDSRDKSASLVTQLGGDVLSDKQTRWTKEAVVRDPQGAVFSISEFSPS